MSKIEIAHFSTNQIYLFIIDTKGRIWRKGIGGKEWSQVGEVPDETVSPGIIDYMRPSTDEEMPELSSEAPDY